MTRYYGSDYCNQLLTTIDSIRDSVNSAGYASEIVDVEVEAQDYSLRQAATNAANSANTHICEIKGKLLLLKTILSQFYDSVDTVASDILSETAVICEELDNVNRTITDLTHLLNGVGSFAGVDVTPALISSVCQPLTQIRLVDVANDLSELLNSDGSLNTTAADSLRTYLSELGITDVSDEDLKALYTFYLFLLNKGWDPEDIVKYLPAILNSSQFGQLYDLINHGAGDALDACMEQLLNSIQKVESIDASNFLVLVDSLTNDSGSYNFDAFDNYRDALAEMGVDSPTDDQIKLYILFVNRMRELGYSDTEIYNLTDDFYALNDLDGNYYVITHDLAPSNSVLDGMIGSASGRQHEIDVQNVKNAAVSFAISMANDNAHGYDQGNRNSLDEFDCSSLVCYSYMYANPDLDLRIALQGGGYNAYTTTTMLSNLTTHGFEKITPTPTDISQLQPGDVLVSSSHTEIYIGNGRTVSASMGEDNKVTGGASGDQTATRLNVVIDNEEVPIYSRSYQEWQDYLVDNDIPGYESDEDFLKEYFDSDGNQLQGEIRIEFLGQWSEDGYGPNSYSDSGSIRESNWTVFRYVG